MREPAQRSGSTLLIEGGGLRGAFAAGVMGELGRSRPRVFDDIVAVSAGAPTAAYYATGQTEDGLRIWRDFTHSEQLISFGNLLRGRPLLDIDRLVDVFARVVPLARDVLGKVATRVWLGVTNCRTGAADYHRATPTNVLDLFRATMALPIANGRVVRLDGEPAIDGGVASPVALQHALSFGAERLLVVLTRPRGYRRASDAVRSLLLGWSYPRFPAVRRTLATHARAANVTLDWIDQLEASGRIDVIRPDGPLAAGRLSRRREDIIATIESGAVAARAWSKRSPW